jgi:hypothetical protein
MNEILLHYLENVEDGTGQGNFLNELGNDETRGGICLHIAITWLRLCTQKAATPPNSIWREMKSPVVIKQIANNQLAYITHNYSIEDNVRLVTSSNLAATFVATFDNVEELKIMPFSPKRLYVICFKTASHALASITVNNKFYLLDPNVGVMTVPLINKAELLGKVYVIYEHMFKMKIINGHIYDIQ